MCDVRSCSHSVALEDVRLVSERRSGRIGFASETMFVCVDAPRRFFHLLATVAVGQSWEHAV